MISSMWFFLALLVLDHTQVYPVSGWVMAGYMVLYEIMQFQIASGQYDLRRPK